MNEREKESKTGTKKESKQGRKEEGKRQKRSIKRETYRET